MVKVDQITEFECGKRGGWHSLYRSEYYSHLISPGIFDVLANSWPSGYNVWNIHSSHTFLSVMTWLVFLSHTQKLRSPHFKWHQYQFHNSCHGHGSKISGDHAFVNGVFESVLCEKNIREITVFYCLRHVLTNLILKEKHNVEQRGNNSCVSGVRWNC